MAVSTIDPNGLNIGQIGGRRNLVINGAMQVAQRGTSFTATATATVYTLDRFSLYRNTGTVGVDQATDSPDGFEYSLKCEVDATGSVSSGTILQITQPIEGYNLTALDWNGGSNAKPATASFWVKSSEAGVYGFRVRLPGVGTFIKEFTINASNTWEHKTVSIPACPYTIPNKTNGTGFFIGVQLVSGSTFYAASDGVWQTADAYGTSGMDNDWIATSGATFQITGVQLEVGDVATPFEHRSYGEELSACQRYFNNLVSYGGSSVTGVLNLASYSTNYAYGAYTFPVEMRAAPSISYSNLADFKSRFGNNVTPTTITTHGTSSNKQTTIQVATTCTAGQAGWLEAINSSAYIYFDAEL